MTIGHIAPVGATALAALLLWAPALAGASDAPSTTARAVSSSAARTDDVPASPASDPGARLAETLAASCDAGRALDCHALGDTLAAGRGVALDLTRALAAFERSCDLGEPLGCFGAGRLLLAGAASRVDGSSAGRVDGHNDGALALPRFRRACEGGVSPACHELGKLLLSSAPADPFGARDAFERACGPYADDACIRLARLLRDGAGGPRDGNRAAEILDAACHTHSDEACTELGRMHAGGQGVARSPGRARQLFGDACERQYQPACHALGDLVLDFGERLAAGLEKSRRAKTPFEKELKRVDVVLSSACKAGELGACTDVAWLAARNSSNRIATLGLLRAACADGDRLACYDADAWDPTVLGWARAALVRDASLLEIAARDEAACEGGEALACARLGLLVERGVIAAAGADRALSLYDKACSGGERSACTQSALLRRRAGDELAATRLLYRACRDGDGRACDHLARSSPDALESDDAVDRDARSLYRRGCDLEHLPACQHLAALDERSTDAAARQASVALYRRACAAGSMASCEALARHHLDGTGAPHDATRALALFHTACDGGQWSSCHAAALLHTSGAAGKKDDVAAAALEEQACHYGVAEACSRLAADYREGGAVRANVDRAADYQRRACTLSPDLPECGDAASAAPSP